MSKRIVSKNPILVTRKDDPIPPLTSAEKARGLIFSVYSGNVKVFQEIWSSLLDTQKNSIEQAIAPRIYDALVQMIYKGQQNILEVVSPVVTTIPGFKSYQNNSGDTLLFHAVFMQKYGMVKALVELGLDPNHINKSGYTPLACSGMLANKMVYNYLKPLVKNNTPILHHTPVMTFTPPIDISLDLDLAVIHTSYVKAMIREDVGAADVVIKKAIAYFTKGGVHVNECLKIVGDVISYYDFSSCVGLLVDLKKALSGSVNQALHLVLLQEICRCYAVQFYHKEADFYGQQVLALLDALQIPGLEEAYANLYYNLAVSCSESNPIKALEYYQKVEEYIPADDDLHLQKALLLMTIGDSVAALASVDAIVDIKQKQILNVFFRLLECCNIEKYNALLQKYEYISDASSIDGELELYAVVIEFYKLLYLSSFSQIKALYVKSIDKLGLDQEVPLLSNLLNAFIRTGCHDDGIKFLKSIGRECFFPHNQKIQFTLLVLYLDSNHPDEAQKYLDYFSEFEDSMYADAAKVKYQHFLFCRALEEKKYERCKELIDPSDEHLASILDRFISLKAASVAPSEEAREESQDVTPEDALPIIHDIAYIT